MMTRKDELICVCMDVNRNAIEAAVAEHQLTTIEEVTALTDAGANCGACHGDIKAIIKIQSQ